MTRAEFNKALGERILPQLQEMGVDGFVMAGYVTDGEGKMSRFASMLTNKSPAIEDGLSKLAVYLAMWSAPAVEFTPPAPTPAPEPDRPGGSA